MAGREVVEVVEVVVVEEEVEKGASDTATTSSSAWAVSIHVCNVCPPASPSVLLSD
jgi:hypothetical protein